MGLGFCIEGSDVRCDALSQEAAFKDALKKHKEQVLKDEDRTFGRKFTKSAPDHSQEQRKEEEELKEKAKKRLEMERKAKAPVAQTVGSLSVSQSPAQCLPFCEDMLKALPPIPEARLESCSSTSLESSLFTFERTAMQTIAAGIPQSMRTALHPCKTLKEAGRRSCLPAT